MATPTRGRGRHLDAGGGGACRWKGAGLRGGPIGRGLGGPKGERWGGAQDGKDPRPSLTAPPPPHRPSTAAAIAPLRRAFRSQWERSTPPRPFDPPMGERCSDPPPPAGSAANRKPPSRLAPARTRPAPFKGEGRPRGNPLRCRCLVTPNVTSALPLYGAAGRGGAAEAPAGASPFRGVPMGVCALWGPPRSHRGSPLGQQHQSDVTSTPPQQRQPHRYPNFTPQHCVCVTPM